LLKRIEDHNRHICAETILKQVAGAGAMDAAGRKALFMSTLIVHSQRIVRLMEYIAGEAEKSFPSRVSAEFERLVARDPSSDNGLSGDATRTLAAARESLLEQMVDDFDRGRLDVDRIEMLIGGGPGAEIVGHAMKDIVALAFPE
jgi:hypothetical protein